MMKINRLNDDEEDLVDEHNLFFQFARLTH